MGLYSQGIIALKHTRRTKTPARVQQAAEADCEKYNAAALAGWLVLRFTVGMVKDGRAIKSLETALRGLESVLDAEAAHQ